MASGDTAAAAVGDLLWVVVVSEAVAAEGTAGRIELSAVGVLQ